MGAIFTYMGEKEPRPHGEDILPLSVEEYAAVVEALEELIKEAVEANDPDKLEIYKQRLQEIKEAQIPAKVSNNECIPMSGSDLGIKGIRATIQARRLAKDRERKRALAPRVTASDDFLDTRTPEGLKSMQSVLEKNGLQVRIK